MLTLPLPTKPRLLASLYRPGMLTLFGLLIGSSWLRTFNLLVLPMFYDEGLHISRAQQVLTKHTLLIETEGGKYLQSWLLALVLPLADNPLLAGRILSAGVGVWAGIGCYLLARHLYQRDEIALTAALLYATGPYVLFFDRMVMADGLLSALAVWVLLLSLVAVRHGYWWQILALGISMGLAAATKLSGVIFLAFPVLAAWLWRGDRPWRTILPGLLVAWLLTMPWLLPSLLDFAPHYNSTIERSWVGSGVNSIVDPVRLGQNFKIIFTTLWAYLTPPLFLLALAEAGCSLRRRDGSSWLLASAALVPLAFFFLLTADADQFYPRYVLPAFPFLLGLAARTLVALADWSQAHWLRCKPSLRRWPLVALALLVSLPALRFDYLLLTDPPRAPWLAPDRWQYIEGWPAGYGVVEAASYLREQANKLGTIIVAKAAESRDYAGAWRHYLDRPNVIFVATNPERADPQQLIQSAQNAVAPVFVVLDRPSEDRYALDFTEGPYAPYSTLVATFARPGELSRIEIYRVTPKP